MGFRIQVSGEFVYRVGEEQIRVPASSFKQGQPVQTASAGFKGDVVDYLVPMEVISQGHQFIWSVSHSLGEEGASIDVCELKKSPNGVSVVSGPNFVVVETAPE
jgi:hypothetical protein